MSQQHILNEFYGKLAELSRLIHSWNLISFYSKSDYETLSEKILRNLYEGHSEIKIKRILESELCGTYGLFNTEFDAEKLSKEIMDWWYRAL